MPNSHSPNHRLVAVFALGILLFTYPFLSLSNRAVTFLGIPLLYLYLFVVWASLVVGIMLITYKADDHKGSTGKSHKTPRPRSLQ